MTSARRPLTSPPATPPANRHLSFASAFAVDLGSWSDYIEALPFTTSVSLPTGLTLGLTLSPGAKKC